MGRPDRLTVISTQQSRGEEDGGGRETRRAEVGVTNYNDKSPSLRSCFSVWTHSAGITFSLPAALYSLTGLTYHV